MRRGVLERAVPRRPSAVCLIVLPLPPLPPLQLVLLVLLVLALVTVVIVELAPVLVGTLALGTVMRMATGP